MLNDRAKDEKRQRFVVEYIKDSNATQAAIRAGFSAKTASAAGARLLRDVQVGTAIEQLRAPILEEAGITLENHLARLGALRDKAEELEQMGPAIAAETNRGKVAGFYTERVEHSGAIETLAFRRQSSN